MAPRSPYQQPVKPGPEAFRILKLADLKITLYKGFLRHVFR
jgi:hypothetical protein